MDNDEVDRKLESMVVALRDRLIDFIGKNAADGGWDALLQGVIAFILVDKITHNAAMAKKAGLKAEVLVEVLRAYADMLELVRSEAREDRKNGPKS